MSRRKKKTPIIILKKTGPKKKQLYTGKLKVIETSQAEKIAKAVASLIPRPKGKKKSTIESRMIKAKRESVKLPFEELVERRLGREEALQEKEEAKKTRKQRSDKGTHRDKWYIDRGQVPPSKDTEKEPEPEQKKPELGVKTKKPEQDKPARPPVDTEVIVEPASEPVHIVLKPKTVENKKIEKLKKTSPVREKPEQKPPVIPFKAPAPVKTAIGDTKKIIVQPPAKVESKTTPVQPMKPKRERIPKKIKHPFPVKPSKPVLSPETDIASSESESSVYDSGDEQTAKGSGYSIRPVMSGTGLKISPPLKKKFSRSQVGV